MGHLRWVADRVTVDPDGCWIWNGSKTSGGYGKYTARGKSRSAHRGVYELLVGPIPDGMQLDHLCRVRACVNPLHLEPVTQRENLLRGETLAARHAAVTECPRGHAYTEDNTYYRSDRTGRDCKACRRQRNNESYARTRHG